MGGIAIESKCGHAFIKERMRHEEAIYGGEISARYYFRDFYYCDSGMLPWLLILELLSITGSLRSGMVATRQQLFPVSGEINRKVRNSEVTFQRMVAQFAEEALVFSHLDGLSIEVNAWRLSLRPSNTEPLLRLNVESRGDESLMRARTA